MNETMRIEVKQPNGKYAIKHLYTATETVYESLAHDLLAKKVHHCTYIVKITDRPLYNGYREIIVYYTGKVRRVYTIKFE